MGGGKGTPETGAQAPACSSFSGLSMCDAKESTASKLNVNLLLVIDKSGSMDDTNGFADSKWESMKQALEGSLTEVQGDLNIGLSLYPMSADPRFRINKTTCGETKNCCEMPTDSTPQILVGPGTDTVPKIIESFVKIRPGGGTPTATALEHALEYYIQGAGKDLKGDKYVVLATDGGPNCNAASVCDAAGCTWNIEGRAGNSVDGMNACLGTSGKQACLDDDATTASIAKLRDAGVQTFVIGVPGSELYGDLLDKMAEEGGRPVEGKKRKYFEVDAKAGVKGLTNIFRTITQDLVTSCDIQLDETPNSFVNVNVAVDCDIIPQTKDGMAGDMGAGGGNSSNKNWIIDMNTEPATIRLRGEVCKRVEAGVERVDVILGCPPVF